MHPTILCISTAINFSAHTKHRERARHDKLVMQVEKMLALTPKLRVAKTEAEKATLQNAVTATDRQIDQLVYELYALTPEEIALVESSGARQPAEGCPKGGRGGARQREQ